MKPSSKRSIGLQTLIFVMGLGLVVVACSGDDTGASGSGGAGGSSGGGGSGAGGSATGGSGAGGSAAGAGGSGAGSSGAAGSGGSGNSGATHPPTCPTNVACTASKAECVNGCAMTCAEYQGQFGLLLQECSAFGKCSVQQSSIGPVATCTGDGIGDGCDSTYVARCEGNVAFNCDFGKVAVTYCASDSQCWAEDEHAGCRKDPLACGKLRDGTKCGGGPDSVPCCPGFLCGGGSCLLPAGSACESILDCNIGLACRTKANRIPKLGEKGICEVPKPACVLPDATSPSNEDERCGRLPGVPCCIAGTSCDPTEDRCCFPAGVVPKVGNTIDSGMCCKPIGTDIDDKCQ